MLAYTGAPRNSGTNNWEITKRHIDGDRHIFDCFERIRDTAVAMRAALERGDWDEVGRQIAIEWDNRKRLAPGVTTPTIDDLIAARDGGRRDGRQGLRRRRRRLPVLLRSAARARPAIAAALAAGGARRARLPHRDRRPAAWITWRSRASSGRSPTSSRSRTTTRSRSARTATAPTSPPTIRTSSRRSTQPALREIPGIGKDLAARIREIAETGDAEFHRELVAEFPPTILDLLHLQGVGPKTVATLYRELGIRTLDDLERRRADGRIRALHGHGREEGGADPQGARGAQAATPAGICCRTRTTRRRRSSAYLRERAPGARRSSRSAACGAAATPAAISTSSRPARRPSLMDDFVGYPLVERVLGHGDTKSSVLIQRRLPGRPAAGRRRQPRRRDAVLHRLEGAQHRAARPRDRPRASS